METEVENRKQKGKKRATRKREPINLKAAPVCCDLFSVKDFDIDAQKLVEDEVIVSDNEEEITRISTSHKTTNGERSKRGSSLMTSESLAADSIFIESDEELNSSQQSRGSPSPPTPPPEAEITQQQRSSRQLSKVMKHAGQALHRTRTFQEGPESPAILIDETPSPKKKRKAIVVKIRSKSGLHRTVLQMEENFENVFDELAAKEKVNLNEIMLSRGEQIVKITDTPASLNLQLAHILDCVIVTETVKNNSILEQVDQDQMITVKVQGIGKSSSTTISIAKTSNFHKLLKKYSDFIGIPEARIKLIVDGDPVNVNSTPTDLDLEDDDVIDAVVT